MIVFVVLQLSLTFSLMSCMIYRFPLIGRDFFDREIVCFGNTGLVLFPHSSRKGVWFIHHFPKFERIRMSGDLLPKNWIVDLNDIFQIRRNSPTLESVITLISCSGSESGEVANLLGASSGRQSPPEGRAPKSLLRFSSCWKSRFESW